MLTGYQVTVLVFQLSQHIQPELCAFISGLTDVLKCLPSWPEERPEELLPLPGFVFSD